MKFIETIGKAKDYIVANWKQLLVAAAIGAGVILAIGLIV